MRRGAALVLGAAAVCSVLRGGFGIAPFRPSASDFHGNLTIANNVLKATTKVTCGAARLLSLYHNALGLYPTPFWYPTHWRVELRCLHIRKRAQGDPTAVRDYSFCGRGGIRTHDLRISCAIKTRTLMHPPFYGKRSDHLNYSHN